MTTKIETSSLAVALAAFQAELPRVGKGNVAKVVSEKGNYTYKYADLADVSDEVLPLLAKHGLSFSAKPTLDGSNRFVLEYTLRHVSGESDGGSYPLPGNATPQQVGSAITYARRYTLCAITGVAPDQDDDGQAASQVRDEPPPPKATPAQVERFDELAKTLAAAESESALKTAWTAIVAAYKADEVTTVQANALRAELDKRKAELAPEVQP